MYRAPMELRDLVQVYGDKRGGGRGQGGYSGGGGGGGGGGPGGGYPGRGGPGNGGGYPGYGGGPNGPGGGQPYNGAVYGYGYGQSSTSVHTTGAAHTGGNSGGIAGSVGIAGATRGIGMAGGSVPRSDCDYGFKLIIIGDAGAGKSSFMHQFLDGKFRRNSTHTIGVEFGTKIISMPGKEHHVRVVYNDEDEASADGGGGGASAGGAGGSGAGTSVSSRGGAGADGGGAAASTSLLAGDPDDLESGVAKGDGASGTNPDGTPSRPDSPANGPSSSYPRVIAQETERQRNIKLQIWDTAGQERYRAVTRSYYRGAVGALILYDVTSRESYNNLPTWLTDAREQASFGDISIIAVGNKRDLKERREVSFLEASRFAQEQGILFLETSALTGESVQDAFHTLAARVLFKVEESLKKEAIMERQRSLQASLQGPGGRGLPGRDGRGGAL